MVTARDQTVDVVQGLKLGADDYVTKPSMKKNFSQELKPF